MAFTSAIGGRDSGITVDVKAWVHDVDSLQKKYGVTAKEAMMEVQRMWGNALIKMTPPKAKREGIGAIKKDMNKLFSPVKNKEHMNFFESLEEEGKLPSDVHVWPEISVGEMQQMHKKSRNKRGRVRGESRIAFTMESKSGLLLMKNANYVPQTKYNRMLKDLKRKVGLTKAGWMGGSNKFKLTAPGFVKSQKKIGSATNLMKDDGSGYLEIHNKVPWIGRFSGLLKIADSFADRNMKKGLESVMKKVAKQFDRIP